MNSAIQCLSNTIELTDYFLKDKFILDLNEKNLLGTKGYLAIYYSKLLKDLWFGIESFVTPLVLKKVIGKFAF